MKKEEKRKKKKNKKIERKKTEEERIRIMEISDCSILDLSDHHMDIPTIECKDTSPENFDNLLKNYKQFFFFACL